MHKRLSFARPHRATLIFGSVLGAALLVRDCNCGKEPGGLNPIDPWSCQQEGRRPGEGDMPCNEGDRFVRGACAPVRCDASVDGWTPGCCPGTICTPGGLCQVPPSRLAFCDTDDDCEDPAQRCLDRPRVTTEGKTCGFLPVSTTQGCPQGTQAFNDRCISQPPCNGGCPAEQVCNIDTNRCELVPTSFPKGAVNGCNQSCGEAQILVYADPDSMLFDQCCAVDCTCATLPSLLPGPWGSYSDMMVVGNDIYVSGYDPLYGDLVLGRFGRISTELGEVQYVDGYPTSGTIVADPTGPRGGRDAAGPNVGYYTSIAQQNGEPRIAYYDLDEKNLKYAAYDSGSGTWNISLVDDGRDASLADTGDVGRYTSLVIDDAGIAHISYYVHRAQPSGNIITGPAYARAKSAAPNGYADWNRTLIEEVASCDAACSANESCVDLGSGPMCRPTRTDCSTACGCDETCVLNATNTASVCGLALPNRLTEPCDGSCPTGTECVSDGAGGNTCLAAQQSGCGTCPAGSVCVDDGGLTCREKTPYSLISDNPPPGVGAFTSMVLTDTGTPVVVYYDALRHHMRAAVGNFDAGSTPGGGFTAAPLGCIDGAELGLHPSLARDPLGGYAIAYQVSFGADAAQLWWCSAADIFDCLSNAELVDDGERLVSGSATPTGAVVGAYASLAFDAAGDPYVAYLHQSLNDLELSYRKAGEWKRTTLLSDGGYGHFARLQLVGSNAYVSNYLRTTNPSTGDSEAHIVIQAVDLTALP